MQRDLDVVVFGATGDTGVAASCCLFFKGKMLGISSWAPAARNLGKLQSELIDHLSGHLPGPDGVAASEPIQADGGDYESLLRMCKRAKVVVACAGPFAQYGEGVVRACVEAGTHYVDVTGEVPWVEKMERKYGEEAEAKGVTVVSMAGYDSVPPDLTAFLAAKALQDQGERLHRFDVFCGGGGGAAPTGTINTLVQIIDAAKSRFWKTVSCGLVGGEAAVVRPSKNDKADSREKKRHYVPEVEATNLRSNLFWSMVPGYSSLGGQFCVPHFMAPININVVHRTAAKEGYGGLIYRERMAGLPHGLLSLYGLLPTIAGVGSMVGLALLLPLPYSTTAIVKLRDTFNPPARNRVRALMFDGFKPTGKTVATGFGVSQGGVTARVQLKCDFDPGLAFTMLSACTLAATIVQGLGSSQQAKPGFHTAVTAVGGSVFADALEKAGVALKVTTQGGSKL